GEIERHIRVLALEFAHGLANRVEEQRRYGQAYLDLSIRAAGHTLRGVIKVFGMLQRFTGRRQQGASAVRQLDPHADAAEKLDPEIAFQVLDALGERRLAHDEAIGGPAKVQ